MKDTELWLSNLKSEDKIGSKPIFLFVGILHFNKKKGVSYMKKTLFIGILVFSILAFSCGDVYAKKAKKQNPITAPVVIKTEPDEQEVKDNVPETKDFEKQDVKAPSKEVQNTEDKTDKSEKVTKEEENKTTDNKEEVSQEEVKVEPVVQVKTQELPKKLLVNPCNDEIEQFFVNFSTLQNKHNVNALKKVYADDFVNSDGYNKTQLFALMTRTYNGYPDLKTEYQVNQIYSTKQFAMANVTQKVTATTKDTSKITKDKGVYKATLETVFYLKKFGKEWKIYSEVVQSEVSTLAYGMAKDVDAVINAPQKVLAGSDYSASVTVLTPDGYSAIASINSTQVVEGYDMNGEAFRQVPTEGGTIERVLKANSLNNNEAIVVSVGFTKLTQDMFKKAKMDISGLMILMKRVDVIPENSNHKVVTKAKNEKK